MVISFVSRSVILHYPFHRLQKAGLLTKGILTSISIELTNFANVFSSNLVFKLPKHIGINDHAIKLVNDHELSYSLIYSLKPIDCKILKAYIEINLADRFI